MLIVLLFAFMLTAQIPMARDGPTATPVPPPVTAAPTSAPVYTAPPPEETPTAHYISDGIPVTKNEQIAESYGLSLMVPSPYTGFITVNPEPSTYDVSTLFKLYMTSIYERLPEEELPERSTRRSPRRSAESVSYGGGWLFSVARYTIAGYEQYLRGNDNQSGIGDVVFFAKNDEYYYAIIYPAECQWDNSSVEDDEVSDEGKVYLDVQASNYYIRNDLIIRYGLTPYLDGEFLLRQYSYDGEHLYMNYYPDFAKDGSKDTVYTLVLSQPKTQGENGIWCVERWYDGEYGIIYPEFPDADGTPSSEYYSKLQSGCDAGKNLDLLDPEQAALDFIRNSRFRPGEIVPGSYGWSDALPEGEFRYWLQVDFDVQY